MLTHSSIVSLDSVGIDTKSQMASFVIKLEFLMEMFLMLVHLAQIASTIKENTVMMKPEYPPPPQLRWWGIINRSFRKAVLADTRDKQTLIYNEQILKEPQNVTKRNLHFIYSNNVSFFLAFYCHIYNFLCVILVNTSDEQGH